MATVSEERGAVRPAGERSSPRPDTVLRDERFGDSLNLLFASLVTKMTGRSVTRERRFTPGGRLYWEYKPSGPDGEMVTTPTATAALEKEWPSDRRFFKSPTGQWRKRTKTGIEGSMNWAQEMLVRAVAQNNPRLMPTPEACESFMGFPVGWTDLTQAGTDSQGDAAARPADNEGRNHAEEKQVTVTRKLDVTMTKSNISEEEMKMKSAEFDRWIKKKRQRPVGICNECGREKELRKREPEPLCGACYMKINRQEKKDADPLAAKYDAKKREKKSGRK